MGRDGHEGEDEDGGHDELMIGEMPRWVLIYMYVYMYVCMYVCIDVCVYVCVYVWVLGILSNGLTDI